MLADCLVNLFWGHTQDTAVLSCRELDRIHFAQYAPIADKICQMSQVRGLPGTADSTESPQLSTDRCSASSHWLQIVKPAAVRYVNGQIHRSLEAAETTDLFLIGWRRRREHHLQSRMTIQGKNEEPERYFLCFYTLFASSKSSRRI